MTFVHKPDDGTLVEKYGMKLNVFPAFSDQVSFAQGSIEVGHLEEFSHAESWFVYFITSGHGTFVINDEHHPAEAGDIVAVPPDHRIHYFGKMEYLLVTSPSWSEEAETHIRMIDPDESPYS